MKIFEQKTQHRFSNALFAIFSIAAIFYLAIPYFHFFDSQWKMNNTVGLFSLFVSISIFVFRNKLKLETKAHFIVSIFIISGIFENLFVDANKGYFIIILSLVVASYFLPKKWVYFYMVISLLTETSISLLQNSQINAILLPFGTLPLDSGWFENLIIFLFVAILTSWLLTKFQEDINNSYVRSLHEKIKYQPLFDQSYSFISVLDFDGNVLESNQAALFYINKKIEDVRGKYFPDTLWWNHSEVAQSKIENALKACKNGDFRRFETTHLNFDGVIEFFDYTLKPIFNPELDIQYIIAEGRDITRIRKTEQALIEGEERLVALSESTYEGLVISDNGIIVEANNSVLKLFKINNINDVIGKDAISMFIHPDDIPYIKEQLKKTNSKPYEVRGIRSDGNIIQIEIEGRDILYKGKKHRISAIRDLTERKQAQQALIESEEKYRLITENINDIIFKLDEKLNFTFASSSINNMLGYTVDEINSKKLSDITTPDSFQLILDQIQKKKELLRSNNKEAWSNTLFESILYHKNGTKIWIHVNAKLIKRANTNSFEILCILKNIDEIKQIQRSFEENKNILKLQNEEYQRLNSELNLLNSELIIAKEKAEESDKLKSAFLSNMSHEIRTPMNSIIGFSKLYQRDDLDSEKRVRYSNFVINSGKQLLNIVNDILDLSKIESDQIHIKSEEIDLNKLIDEIYNSFQENNNKGIYCTVNKGLHDDSSLVFADGNRLKQIISNLTKNAYKFTKKGSVEFGYSIVNENIIFYVEDTGIGISPEYQEKIFERFRQVEFEPSRVFGGAGLGLSISKKLVEIMKGKIWLKSKPGVGSTFYFSIPYFAAPITEDRETTETETIDYAKNGSKTILIAEDDESNFEYLNEILLESQYEIIWVKNGKEAVENCLSNDKINLVLMDIKMPIMDGLEATKKIKSVRPNLPIIAQTAYAMADDKETAIKCGCDDYTSKPIDAKILKALIEHYI